MFWPEKKFISHKTYRMFPLQNVKFNNKLEKNISRFFCESQRFIFSIKWARFYYFLTFKTFSKIMYAF